MTNNKPSFSIISGKVCNEIIFADMDQTISAVEMAYLAHLNGRTINPDSYFLRFPENPSARIIALPAHLAGGENQEGVSGIKWISSYPSNLNLGIPRASAVLILNDAETGYPFACLESSIISAARTAASAVSGAYHINGKSRTTKTIGVVGTGLIARFILNFLFKSGWKTDEVILYDQNASYAEAFKERFESDYGLNMRIVESDHQAIKQSTLSVLATTAATPYLSDPDAFSHNPLVLNISLRDVHEDIILNSINVVDDIDHCLKANTSVHLAYQKAGNRDFIHGTLPELIHGKTLPAEQKPIILTPFGMGILDIALGQMIYNEAQKQGRTIVIDDFFYELERI